jgi:hypothetical protein
MTRMIPFDCLPTLDIYNVIPDQCARALVGTRIRSVTLRSPFVKAQEPETVCPHTVMS